MFNNMKNKIKEKTGAEVPKFKPISNVFSKNGSKQHSRQNSQGSIVSISSEHGITTTKDENIDLSKLNGNKFQFESSTNSTEEPSINWENRCIQKEKEWEEKERIYVADLLKQTRELQEALSQTEETKKKLIHCQEEKDNLEQYQRQEVTKLKTLLLTKEEETNTKDASLKDACSQIESLKREMNRLVPFEAKINDYQDDLEFLRHTSEKERWNLTSELAQKDEKIRHLEERISVLTHRTEADCQALGTQLSTDERVRSLVAERTLLERRLEEAHIHLSEIKSTWSNKIANLETQVGRLSRQAGEEGVERRNAENKILELESKLQEYEMERENVSKQMEKLRKERDNIALELKQLSADLNNKSEESNYTEQIQTMNSNIEILQKENDALRLSNEEIRTQIEKSLYDEITKNKHLNDDKIKLENYVKELSQALDSEKKIKDETLLRNAEVSQMVQLCDQESKQLAGQNEELNKKVISLEKQLQQIQQKAETKNREEVTQENNFATKINEIENQLNDKDKLIRILQQNLSDVKKTLQNELVKKTEERREISEDCKKCAGSPIVDDVNFTYMKNVLIKFLTSTEYEAQQLTKAVATLLKLNTEEERLIRDTLELKTSWFSSKRRVKISI